MSRRTPDWIKLKCTQRQEFVIGGWTEPQGSRTGIGSLLLGVHDEAGQLRYAGSVGTGFDAEDAARGAADSSRSSRPTKPPFCDRQPASTRAARTG